MDEGGSENVIMRLSETDMLHEESKGLKPSAAFKFLRDGVASDNIVVMPSFENSGSWNFLKKEMLTRVAPFEDDSCPDLTLRKKLTEGQQWPYSCGIHEIFKHLSNGSDLDDSAVNTPYELSFEANEPYATMFSDEKEYDADGNQVNWYDQLKTIKKGAELFSVKALVAPPNHSDYAWVTIGTITLTTDLYTSEFGDDRLFF